MQPFLLPWRNGEQRIWQVPPSPVLLIWLFSQFVDNTNRVQKYTPGQVLNIVLDIINHHPVGYAVSLTEAFSRLSCLHACP
jgi:hypothetical protein